MFWVQFIRVSFVLACQNNIAYNSAWAVWRVNVIAWKKWPDTLEWITLTSEIQHRRYMCINETSEIQHRRYMCINETSEIQHRRYMCINETSVIYYFIIIHINLPHLFYNSSDHIYSRVSGKCFHADCLSYFVLFSLCLFTVCIYLYIMYRKGYTDSWSQRR